MFNRINFNFIKLVFCLYSLILIFTLFIIQCGDSNNKSQDCGPLKGNVTKVIDGDTIQIDNGIKIRYLMVNAPELSSNDCFAEEAKQFNSSLVENQTISLSYDKECKDKYNRLLAYVSIQDREINALLVERGYACSYYISPNGKSKKEYYDELEYAAKTSNKGMWGVCNKITCK